MTRLFSGECQYKYVDYELDYSECECDDSYCHCKSIVDKRITNIDYYHMATAVAKFVDQKENEILIYAVEKFIKNTVKEDDFEIITGSGYYGEELYNIKLDESVENNIITFASSLAKETDADVIKCALTNEHGWLTAEHKNISDVLKYKLSSREFISKIEITNVSPNLNKVKLLMDSIPDNFVVQKFGEKLKLIDGHHRFQALLNQLMGNNKFNIEIYSKTDIENFESILKKKKRIAYAKKMVNIHELVVDEPDAYLRQLENRIEDLESKVKQLERRLDNV
jgi:hypothetical protein